MNNYISLCCLCVLLFSCKETTTPALNTNEQEVLTNPLQTSQGEKDLYKTLKKKAPLTEAQLAIILPKEINGNAPVGEFGLKVTNQLASGMYQPIGKKGYSFFIQDGAGSSAIVRNFFTSFKTKPQGPPQTEYIYSERDGYKTIAFIQSKIKRNSIGFVYNNRFKISIEGPDDVDVLWTYIDFENLKKLNKYN
ncbi:hypothetical protein MWU65_07550 [Cellulophaga sp. F20128]|uniref:hypothetical protein n=1 Tax=Cellulophaga sp. F20128 TaxID=2926413 RepID=UPI001FF0FC30|nr:hypothetical protein [Cellulophaga sp. F20128]MCK0157031.1 hypothetical protein [Cellulophaga sp. F20128]